MEPLISVIVPVYKVEAYLPKCLDSIINQTYRNLEIILVDDGSPDGCGAICDRYAEQDSRVRVIHQENAGVSSARNAGLDIMTGEYLTFVDSDDWLAPNAIEVLFDRIQRDGSDMVIGQRIKVFGDGTMGPASCTWMGDMKITGQEAMATLGTETPVPCCVWGSLEKRAVYQDLRFPKITRAEDLWIFPDVLDSCRTISLDSRIIYYYYQRNTSIIHNSTDVQKLDNIAAEFHVAQVLIQRNLWNNAASYCMAALSRLGDIEDAQKVRRIVKDVFSIKEWAYLIGNRPRCVLYILFCICLQQPGMSAEYGEKCDIRSAEIRGIDQYYSSGIQSGGLPRCLCFRYCQPDL